MYDTPKGRLHRENDEPHPGGFHIWKPLLGMLIPGTPDFSATLLHGVRICSAGGICSVLLRAVFSEETLLLASTVKQI